MPDNRVTIFSLDIEHSHSLHSVDYTNTWLPGGEPHISLPSNYDKSITFSSRHIILKPIIRNSNDLIELFAVTDLIRRRSPKTLSLLLYYFPGGRQDRYEGGTFTADMYAKLIKAQNYDKIFIVDPHSYVTAALLGDNCHAFEVPDLFGVWDFKQLFDEDINGLICPDTGAEKKVNKIASILYKPVVYGRKIRDPKTGKIKEYVLDKFPVHGKWLVWDDICDGGATFIEIAKAAEGVRLHLFVSHGIFSKGLDELTKYYDKIITLDGFGSYWQRETEVKEFNLRVVQSSTLFLLNKCVKYLEGK